MANLLKRDEAELTGKVGIGAQAYEAFGEEAGEDKLETVEEFPDAFKPAAGVLASCPAAPRNTPSSTVPWDIIVCPHTPTSCPQDLG